MTLGEAALIAGIIRRPNAYSPWTNFDAARRRSFVVLQRMREEGKITPAQEQAARAERIRIQPQPAVTSAKHGYAKEYLRQQFRNIYGGDNPPDWKVHTTFVPELQDAAEVSVREGLRRLGAKGLQAALVAMDPQTGNLLAMVGGSDFATTTFNRAVRSRRQPGSAFKPFVYAAALERGLSPVSTITGIREVAVQAPEGVWIPRDERANEQDEMTLREALLESNNAAAVLLQQRVGRARCCGSPATLACGISPTCRRSRWAAGSSRRSISRRRMRCSRRLATACGRVRSCRSRMRRASACTRSISNATRFFPSRSPSRW